MSGMWHISRRWRRRLGASFFFGLGLGLAVLCGMALRDGRPESTIPPDILLRASGSHGGQTMALATGKIEDGEGLFVLDYLTGVLSCYVINPRAGSKFNARFTTSVVQALGVEQGKKPDYVMVTGTMDFIQGPAASRPGGCVVYVADANTGNFGAWGVPWNRQAAQIGRPQEGPLVLLDFGKARNLEIEQAAP